MASKHDRKDEQHDLDLGEVYSRTELFLEKNKRAVSIAVTGILVVVAAVLGYKRFYAEPRAKEASDLIWKAQYYFEIDSLDLAINGDGNYFGFQYIADAYGSTPSGELAKYYLGNCYLQKGDYEAAIDYLKKADLDDDILSVMAIGCIGDAYVELDRPQDAIDQFEKAANMRTNDMTTPMYLMKAAILYQQNGDWGKAAKAFRRVAQDFPASPDANEARKYAARAEAMAGDPMATAEHPLSEYDPTSVPSGAGRRFALVVSEWNREITEALRQGARKTLLGHGVQETDPMEAWVPGSFELAAGAQMILGSRELHGVICLGSIVRGETPHFDHVCQATARGIMDVGLKHGVPVIFGVLTDDNMEQARDRSGGRHGNKGVDCAVAVLKMAELWSSLKA